MRDNRIQMHTKVLVACLFWKQTFRFENLMPKLRKMLCYLNMLAECYLSTYSIIHIQKIILVFGIKNVYEDWTNSSVDSNIL